MKKNVNILSSESMEQQKLFDWINIAMLTKEYRSLKLMYHIPNEGKRTAYTGNKMKREGLVSGVADICLPVPKGYYHGLYIEMKYNKNKLTESQKNFLRGVREQGYATAVCYSADEAVNKIKHYYQLGEFLCSLQKK